MVFCVHSGMGSVYADPVAKCINVPFAQSDLRLFPTGHIAPRKVSSPQSEI